MKAQELFERVNTAMANGKTYEEAWQMANAGTSEGAKKGWEHRGQYGSVGFNPTPGTDENSLKAWAASDAADKASWESYGIKDKSVHENAARLHEKAATAHAAANYGGTHAYWKAHETAEARHRQMAKAHRETN